MNNNFKARFFEFPQELRKNIPVIYNCIYRFNKKGLIKKKGDRYYGVLNKPLQTTMFFPWGHEKPISRSVDFSIIKPEKETDAA